jgi:CxxC motif-containing protein
MKELVCIVCPNGCALTINTEGQSITVTGNKCPKGEIFAVTEETNPTRTICSTVKTAFPNVPVLPVRVSAEIPKNRISDVMCEINKIMVRESIKSGDAVIANVLGLGVDIIATSNILKDR